MSHGIIEFARSLDVLLFLHSKQSLLQGLCCVFLQRLNSIFSFSKCAHVIVLITLKQGDFITIVYLVSMSTAYLSLI